jgi:ABC-2 type transport system permease protein
MVTIIRKELADYFTSIRCLILFILVILASAVALYATHQGIREVSTESGFVFTGLFTVGQTISLVNFIALLIPLIGIVLGFDAINREYSTGTMSRILSQPVYRDSVINGKFLAGMVTLFIMILTAMLLVGGYGLRMIGVPPEAEEIIRLFIYFFSVIIYGAFWMGLAILFSVLFRNLAISLLCPLAIWIFLGIPVSVFNPYISFIAPAVTNSVGTYLMLLRISPYFLFSETTAALLDPLFKGIGMFTGDTTGMLLYRPLSLGQSLLVVWPQLTTLIGLAVICFAVSYIVFMRQEIRAT